MADPSAQQPLHRDSSTAGDVLLGAEFLSGAVAAGAATTLAGVGAAHSAVAAAEAIATVAPGEAASEMYVAAQALEGGVFEGGMVGSAIGTAGLVGVVAAGAVLIGAETFPEDENRAAGVPYSPNDTASHEVNSSIDDGLSHAPADGWE